jgi:hypothetical protein
MPTEHCQSHPSRLQRHRSTGPAAESPCTNRYLLTTTAFGTGGIGGAPHLLAQRAQALSVGSRWRTARDIGRVREKGRSDRNRKPAVGQRNRCGSDNGGGPNQRVKNFSCRDSCRIINGRKPEGTETRSLEMRVLSTPADLPRRAAAQPRSMRGASRWQLLTI